MLISITIYNPSANSTEINGWMPYVCVRVCVRVCVCVFAIAVLFRTVRRYPNSCEFYKAGG